MRPAWKPVAVGAAVGLAALALVAVLRHRAEERPTTRPAGGYQHPTTASLTGAGGLRGLAMELYSTDPAYRYEHELDELAGMHTQVLCLAVRGMQENVKSSRVFIDHLTTPTPETLVAVIQAARKRGMQVLLLPIVLLWDTDSDDDWRGEIAPRRWDRWWESYERFIVHYARLAEEGGAEMFSVGSELISTETRRNDWAKVIRAVRGVYSGQLLYSANWDHYTVVSFWDQLDLVGMTAYHTLTTKSQPSLTDLRSAWARIKEQILAWQRGVGRRIVFTEVGYASQDGCARAPWNYYASRQVDLEEQYLCLRAFFETWYDEPAVAATCIWKWEGEGGETDLGYTPRGKPSEVLLRRWLLGGPLDNLPTTFPTAGETPAVHVMAHATAGEAPERMSVPRVACNPCLDGTGGRPPAALRR